MFKLIILVACAFICSVQSAPLEPTVVPIISSENVVEPDGKFHFNFETGDGIKAHEEGELKEVDKELVETVKGGWEYTAPDGKLVAINYVADETGYHPSGDSIPEAPPLPESVVKLLQYLEAHPQPVTSVLRRK